MIVPEDNSDSLVVATTRAVDRRDARVPVDVGFVFNCDLPCPSVAMACA
jgi:hypothetical protein